MKTTKRPAWQITPGTHILIDGERREIVETWLNDTKVRLGWRGPFRRVVTTSLDRLSPVVIVLDP